MVNELKSLLLDFLKLGLLFLINKCLLFQYSGGICSVTTRVMAVKVAQKDLVAIHLQTRTQLAVESQERFWNKRTNIETLENG